MGASASTVGMKFGRLTVTSNDLIRSCSGHKYVLVTCECGTEKSVRLNDLLCGRIKTCGCGKKLHNLKHGHNKIGNKSSEYMSWDSMVQRCTNPKHPAFEHYGGRGITVCDEWLNFEKFLSDMGEKPSAGLSIERKKNELGYYKENCIWATQSTQMRNTRRTVNITVLGVTKCLSEWAAAMHIDRRTILSRINKGWSESDAVLTPTRRIACP